jgi:peptidoglycan hydrolase CwlO-like protein
MGLAIHDQIAFKHAKLADLRRLREQAQAKLNELLDAAAMAEKVQYSIADMDADISRVEEDIEELGKQMPPAP